MGATSDELIQQATTMLWHAQHVTVLTGAGISTASGIPDFRSPDTGLWANFDPMAVASLMGFWDDPGGFYQWMRPLAELILEARPNPAHEALSQLEAMGRVKAIVTQNIDLLHSRAGSRTVYEVHGHMREATCTACFTVYQAEPLMRDYLQTGNIPTCDLCGGVLKPNVILFGEQLPATVMLHAKQAIRAADLLVVIGSSLEVYPVADLPRLAQEYGAKVMIINLQPTHFDANADLVLNLDAVDALPAIVKRLQRRVSEAP